MTGRYPQLTRTRKMIAKTLFSFLLFSSFHLGYSFVAEVFRRHSLIPTVTTCGGRAGHGSVLSAASRMPVFNEEEEEQLRKIMAGEFWDDDMPDFSDNLPTREKSKAKSAAAEPAAAVAVRVAPNSASAKKVVAPNANWRTATDTPVPQPLNPLLIPKPATLIKKKKPVPTPSSDFLDFSDLDYDDFESAMR